MGEDETKGKGSVDDDGFWMDDDCHLEWDRVEDNDEKNGDENVGAEEQGKQRYGSDAVAGKKVFILWPSQPLDFKQIEPRCHNHHQHHCVRYHHYQIVTACHHYVTITR